ncbi:MAG: carboxypeptidase regulatory-like domain-containing protein [Prevotella sp.]|nr:carboxypeptidase regulatory-like domain-containing protein [Prevotella sp.]
MKHFKHLFLLMLIMMGLSPAIAQTQTHEEPYEVDFNTSISTSSGFSVAPGWQHIVDGNMYYSYNSYNGYAGGWLYTNSNQAEGVNDLLVTPLLSGDVSMLVKVYSSSHADDASLRLFAVTEGADGELQIGDELPTELEFVTEPEVAEGEEQPVPALSTSSFVRVRLARGLETPTMVGIRMAYVGIDNFHADEADVVLRRGLTIASAQLNTKEPEVTPEGTYTLKFNFYVRNTGEVDLKPGDEGYEVKLYMKASEAATEDILLRTIPIDQALAVNQQSSTTSFEVVLNYDDYPDTYSYYFEEGISGTRYNVYYSSTPVPYKADFKLTDNNSNEVKSGTTIDFGLVQGEQSKTYRIYNNGTAPLSLTGLDVEGDFAVEGITAETVVSPKSYVSFNIVAKGTQPGEQLEQITISSEEGGDYALIVKAVVAEEGKWFEPFNDSKVPVNMPVVDGYWYVSNGMLYQSSNMEGRIQSPMITLAEGEAIMFEAMGYDSSYNSALLNVYWSTDRNTWTKAAELSTSGVADEWKLSTTTKKIYSVTGLPAGNIYLMFGDRYCYIDNIYGGTLVETVHDMVAVSSNIPAEAQVNNAYSASVTLKNANTETEAAGQYKVRMYADGEVVAETEGAAIEPGKQLAFNLSYTPHKAGVQKVYVAFEAEDYVMKTAEVDVNVAEEQATSQVQVGDYYTNNNKTPLDINNSNTESEAIYTAENLKLAAGTKINKITWRGYSTSKDVTTDVQVWIENTEDVAVGSDMKDVSTMTCIYDGQYTFRKQGGSNNRMDMLTVNLTEPFVYEGQSLRIHVRSMEINGYTSVYFENTNITGQCLYRSSFSTTDFSQMSLKNGNLPVVYLDVEKDPTTLSGNVTLADDASPVADQTVTLTSGNVLYEATTDAEGHYTMNVIQDQLTYQLRIEKEGYNPFAQEVSFTGGSQVVNAALVVAKPLAVDAIEAPAEAVANNDVNVTVKATNYSSTLTEAGSYTARLLNAAGEQIAEADAVALAAGEQHDYVFSFHPTEVGLVEVYAVFEGVNFSEQTEHVTINVKEETALADIVIANPSSYSYSTNYNCAFDLYGSDDKGCQAIYTPAQMGIEAGINLRSIALRGYNTGNAVTANVRLFLQNTEDTEDYLTDQSEMQQVFEGRVTFEKGGSSNNRIVMLNMPLTEPFVYEGKNMRIWIELTNQQGTSSGAYFEYFNETEYISKDGGQTWKTNNYKPVLYATISTAKQLVGNITDVDGNALPGATVTLTSPEAVYTGKADNQGHYYVEVVQTENTYTATFSVEGFETKTIEGISFAEGHVEQDVVLSYAAREFAEGEVYTICLPVALDEAAVRKAGHFYALNAIDGETIGFKEVTTTEAYVPYIYKATDGSDLFADMDAWTIDAEANTTATVDNVSFIGTMSRQHVVAEEGVTCYGYSADNGTFGKITSAFVSPFRAYLKVEGETAAKSYAIEMEDLPVPTGVVTIDNGQLTIDNSGNVYDLQGRLVSHGYHVPPIKKGIYIINGKKTVVK